MVALVTALQALVNMFAVHYKNIFHFLYKNKTNINFDKFQN